MLVGLALKQLYLAAPNVPWYGGYLFVTAALSLAAVAFACLKRDTSPAEICLTVMFLCLVGAPFLIVLQFTRVAFLATLAGLLLLAAVVRDSRPARQAFWAIPFLVAGALIRIDSFLVARIVLSPLVAWMVWRSRSQARRTRAPSPFWAGRSPSPSLWFGSMTGITRGTRGGRTFTSLTRCRTVFTRLRARGLQRGDCPRFRKSRLDPRPTSICFGPGASWTVIDSTSRPCRRLGRTRLE